MRNFLRKRALYIISAIAIIFGCLFVLFKGGLKVEAAEQEISGTLYAPYNISYNDTQNKKYGNWSWTYTNSSYFTTKYNGWEDGWNTKTENDLYNPMYVTLNSMKSNGSLTFTYNNSSTKYKISSVELYVKATGTVSVSGKYGNTNASGGTSFNDKRKITLTMGKTTDNITITFTGPSTGSCTLHVGYMMLKQELQQNTVTLDKQGGTGGSNSVTATYNSAMPSATMPTKTGYTFQGYYDAKSGGNMYYKANGSSNKNWDKTSNTTLYARWSAASYTVTLDSQGGTTVSGSVSATYNSAMPSATMPTKEGYIFRGYYDAVTGGTKYYNADGTSAKNWDKASNTTLYARWVKPLVGEGTEENPYQLGTKADLERFRDIVDGLNDETKNAEACAILTADIDLEGSETNKWIPIGINTSDDSGEGFGGTFDGKNHKIYNLYVDNTTYKAVGFFGNVRSDNGTAVVKNLTIASGTVKGANQVGGVIGFLSGSASNLHNYADVTATGKKVGGIIGCAWDGISFCHNEGNITSTSTADDSMVGGIAGYVSVSTVEQCYNVGEIKSNGGQVGGIVGYNNRANVINTFNYGKVTGNNYSTTGSIFGSYTSNYDFGEDSPNSKNNYFLKGTASIGTGSGNYTGKIEQLTLKEFKDKSNFKNWYFNNVWTMGDNYPVFREIGEDKDGNKIIFDKDFLLSLEDGQKSFTKDGITVNIGIGGFYFGEDYETHEKMINIYSYEETGFEFASSVGKILEIKITFSDYSSLYDWALVDNTAIWMSTPADKVYFQQCIYGVEKIEVIVAYNSNEVKNLINAIGTVTLTDDSKAKIDAAREAYDLLDDSQKANVNNYNILTAAEAKYEELLDAATVVEVNGVRYATFQEAFDAVEENGTIKLTKDLNLMDSHIEVSKSITIDLNGHNLKITYTDNIDKASLYIEKQNIVLTVDNSKPETGGVDGYITFGNKSQLLGNTYVLFRNCRTMYNATELGNAVDSGFYKINPSFEVVDIDDGTYYSLVRLTKVVDLSKLTTDYVVLDGQTLTGKLGKAVKISIEDGATITLDNATIDMGFDSNNKWSGLTCLGDANIILKGENVVYGFADGFAGIFVAENYTLTIDGNGLLYAEGGNSAAAIGGIMKNYLPLAEQEGKDGGSIIINNGGIYAVSNGYGAAIGSAMYNSFEDITINGGVVVAKGGKFASGIGTGDGGRCKNITINGGTVIATAGDCNPSNLSTGSAGIGAAYYGLCGNITINKDVVKVVAYSSGDADPIGKSTNHATCGNINIASSLTTITDDTNCVAMISADLYINGQAVNDNNNSGTGWSYDKETNTLTLTDFVLENNGDLYYDDSNVISASIAYFGKDALNIVLNGENIITNTFDEEKFAQIAGILSMTNLNISGNGSLNVKVTGTAYSNFAIRCFGEMTVESATIVADAGTSIKQSVGIYANGGLELNSGNITATGVNATNTEDNFSYGIDVAGNVVTVKKQVKNFNANGFVAAIFGQLITASNGFGIKNDETQVEITAGETSIDVSDYKKVQIIGYTSQDVINMIDALGDTEYTQDYFDAISEARGAYETLSDTEKAEVTNYDDLTAAETAYNALAENAIDDVIAKIDAIGTVAYTDASKALIDAANDAYNALVIGDEASVTNADTLTAANTAYDTLKNAAIADVIAKIDAIGTVAYTDASKELLDAANDAYNALLEGDEAAITNADTLTAANIAYDTLKNAAIANAIAKIDAIGTVAYTGASKALIDAARDAYDVILEEDQDEITNVAKLTDAETLYNNVNNVVTKIDAIGTVAYTDASKTLIDDAKAAYDLLTADELAILPEAKENLLTLDVALYYNVDAVVKAIDAIGDVEYTADCKSKIDAAKALYDELEDGEMAILPEAKKNAYNDAANAYMAMDAINAIGTVVNTADCKTAIENARLAYDSIPQTAQALVANYKTLTDDEAVFAVIDKVNAIAYENTADCLTRIQEARLAYDALDDEQEDIFPADVLKTLEDCEDAFAVMQKIDAIGTIENTKESRELVTDAREAYDDLLEEQQDLVLNYDELLAVEASFEAVDNVTDLIKAIDPLKYPDSKDELDEARDAYDALTPFEQGLVPNYDNLVARETAFNNADDAVNKINAIGVVKYPGSKANIETARGAYDALTAEEKNLVGFNNLATLAAAEGYYNSLRNNALADDVIDMINAIAPLEISDACKARIDAARAAYDALENDDQKALVENYEDLVNAEYDYMNAKPVVDLIEAIGELDATEECQEKIDLARDEYDDLTNSQKALVYNYDELVDKEAAKPVVDQIAAITAVEPTAECEEAIDAAREAYDALTDDQQDLVINKDNLFNAEAAKPVADLIGAIAPLEISDDCKERIDDAKDAYDALTADQKALVDNYEDLANAAYDYMNAKPVVDLIDAIGDIDASEGCQDKIDLARDEYDDLTNSQKALIYNYDELVDKEAAKAAVDLIDAIGDVVYPTSKDAIEDARAAYDALTENQKALVPNEILEDLEDAEATYKELDDTKKAADAKDLIDAIGEVEYPDSKDAIEDARAAYDALTADQKALIPEETLKTLEDAEELYNAVDEVVDLIDAIGTVEYPDSKEDIDAARDAYEALSEEAKELVPDAKVDALEDAEAEYQDLLDNAYANAVIDLVNAIGTVKYPDSKEDIDAARAAYDALTDDQKTIVGFDNYAKLVQAEGNYEAQKDLYFANKVKKLIKDIAPLAVTEACKARIDAARAAYDDEEFTAKQRELVTNYADLVKAETDYAAAKEVVDLINELPEKVIEARAAYDELTDDQKALVYNYDDLLLAEASLVDTLIDAIGDVEYTDECKEKIDEARAEYNALADDQKAKVTKLADLEDAEEAFADLRDDAIEAAIDAIDAIGEVEYTEASKTKIDAAKEAYDAVLANDKTAVTNSQKLTAAETAYNTLKANHEAAEAVDALIDAIGDVEYTEDCKDAIDAAREAYDALTADQKALVTKLEDLTKAEGLYGAVDAVAAKIEAIPSPLAIADGTQTAITNARAAYDALTNDQKAIVPADMLADLVDNEAAYAVMLLIDAIKPFALDDDCKTRIDAAQTAYDKLTENQKALVANAEELEDAEEEYNEFIDETKASAVDDLIDAIGTVTYPASENAIKAARDAYNALTADQKALVTKLEALENAEASYKAVDDFVKAVDAIGTVELTDACKEKVDAAFDAYIGLGVNASLIPAETKKTFEDKISAYLVMEKINEIGDVEYTKACADKVKEAKEAYDLLENDAKALVANYEDLTNALDMLTHVDAVVEKINDITQPLVVNNEVAQEIEDARSAYDLLTEAEEDIFPADKLALLEDIEDAFDTMKQINDIPATIDITDEACLEAIEAAREAYDDLTEAEQALVTNYEVLENAEVAVAKARINAIGTVAYTENCKNLIDAARDAYDALDDTQKALVDNYETLTNAEAAFEKLEADHAAANAVIDLIDAIGTVEYTNASKKEIDDATAAYNKLTNDQRNLVNNFGKLADAEDEYAELRADAIDDAIDAINAIGTVEYTEDCETKIDAARDAYDAVLDSDKNEVTNYNKLTKAEADYAKLEADHEAAADVVDMINAITTPLVIAEDTEKAIEDARTAYEALTADQKALVSDDDSHKLDIIEIAYGIMELIDAIPAEIDINDEDCVDAIFTAKGEYEEAKADVQALVANVSKLNDALDTYNDLIDEAAAAAVDNLIDAIGEVEYTEDCKNAIDAARDAYEALTEAQQDLVLNIDELEDAEAAYDKLEADHIAADEVIDLIEAIGDVTYPASENAIKAAREAYDALTADQKPLVTNYDTLTEAEATYAKLEEDVNAANDVDDLIEAIGTVTYPASENAIKAARDAYDALTADQKALVTKLDTLTSAETTYAKSKADAEAAKTVADKINAIGTVTYPASENAIKAARDAYNALTADQKALVTNLNTLTTAETTYAKLKADAEAAKAVTDKINAIGTVTYPTSENAIKAARAAYDALTADQKALVTNLNTLTTAETTYANKKADTEAAKAVTDKINAIGKVKYPASKTTIEAARAAYDALTTDQKALVTNVDTLTAAEATYKDVDDVYKMINEIGTVTYSKESQEKINGAREAYDKLTEEEKGLITNYKTLVSDEAQYSKLENDSKSNTGWSIGLIALGGIIIVAGVVYVILYPNKKKEEK